MALLFSSFIIGIMLPLGFKMYQSGNFLGFGKETAKPVKLTLLTDTRKLKTGAAFAVKMILSTPDTGVEAADFVLSFDPNYLKVETLATGNFFKIYPVSETQENYVKVTGIASLVNDTFLIPKGEGTVATVTFTALKATPNTAIKFDKKKTIVASGGKNVIGEKNMGELSLTIVN